MIFLAIVGRLRLRHRVRMVEKEHRDLLVRLLADVDGAVNARGRLVQSTCPAASAIRSLGPPSRYSIARASPRSTTVTRSNGSLCQGIAAPGARRNRRTRVVPRRWSRSRP